MGFYSDPWLREARNRVALNPEQPTSVKKLTGADFDKLADAVEKAIKAALIENYGSLPAKHDHKNLVSICQSTGMWDVLPPALKNLVKEIESYHSAVERERHNSDATNMTTPEKIQVYFTVARRLIDYMEYHVIGNDSVLRRLRVV